MPIKLWNPGVEGAISIYSGPRPQQLANDFLTAIGLAQPGATMELGHASYNEGSAMNVPVPGITILGQGRERTRLLNGFNDNIQPGCSFECSDGTVIENLTLVNDCGENQQSETVGFGSTMAAGTPGATTPGAHLILRRLAIIGLGFGVYQWASVDNTLIEVDWCDVFFQRWGLTCGRSSGPQAGNIDVYRSRFFGNSAGYTYSGLQGPECVAFCCRGGRTRVYDSYVEIIGDPTITLAAGMWIPTQTAGGQANPSTIFESYNTNYRIAGGGAPQVFDLVATQGSAMAIGGSGSGPNYAAARGFNVNGNVSVY